MEVRVTRSARRRRTVQARLDGDTLHVRIPAGLSAEEERRHIEALARRAEGWRTRQEANRDGLLRERFDALNRRYFGGRLRATSIEFVADQDRSRGSCTPARGAIRVSHRLRGMPLWVLDYVVMHEMAHLVHPDHSRAFWAKVHEYPRTERARGFLIAREMEPDDDGAGEGGGGE